MPPPASAVPGADGAKVGAGCAGADAGLSTAEAAARRKRDGPNALPQAEGRRWARVLLEVVSEPMSLLLLAAAGIYLWLGDDFEAGALGVSALFVIGLSFVQQQRAETALRALRDLASPRAEVRRDGRWCRLPAAELVVGDRIDLREGDRVPADARLVAGPGVTLDESLLTGESAPVRRSPGMPDAAERRVLAGTLVVAGRAQAVVTATGARSELGRIGHALRAQRPRPTATQREMHRAVWLFSALGFLSCLLVVLLYFRAYGDWLHGLLAGITLAVANVPEEFPLVLTVFLAIGAWRLARGRVLVRRPPAIEALGAITVLCSDKTGTMTVNRMQVAKLAVGTQILSPSTALPAAFEALLAEARLASQADPHDPMECAIADLATPVEAGPLVRTYPLEDALAAFAQVWQSSGEVLHVACKGAPETVVRLCRLADADAERVLAQAGSLASGGLRVLAVARGSWSGAADTLPRNLGGLPLQWCGLVAFADPLREGVPGSVAEARAAGIRVVMMTGDHPDTAREIARQAGLPRWDAVVLGPTLEGMDDAALDLRVREADVFARVRPEHKLRLVGALKRQGEIVAMTGDGVNDAPALAMADIGVAMGLRGTDVAREASGIVLLDDDFSTVVRAVRLGRGIYENLRRAVRYVVAVHVPITGLALLPLLLGTPMLLQPLHVVFLELIVDPACSVVLEREPPTKEIMQRPPRPPRQHLLDLPLLLGGLCQGAAVFGGVIVVYLVGLAAPLSAGEQAATAFASLVAGNVGLIWLNRTPRSDLARHERGNPAFLLLVVAAVVALALATSIGPVPGWLGFQAVPPATAFLAAVPPVLVVLAIALVRDLRRRSRRAPASGGPLAATRARAPGGPRN